MLVSTTCLKSGLLVIEATTTQLRKTALNSAHRRMGAKMVNFGGWDMPIEYSGIVNEHMATRTAAGLFDVSHMGEIELRGPQALDLVQFVTCNDASRLTDGQAQYSGLMTSAGTFVDDLLVHKISDGHYFLCVNASNQEKDFNYIRSAAVRFSAKVENAGERYSQLAIQGPRALGILTHFTHAPIAALQYYHFLGGEIDGVRALVARTGYTGEDGFEIYFAPDHTEKLWNDLLEVGRSEGLLPCGLGARNTLRLEAGMCLYGQEIDATTTVWEANLGWICKLGKGDFLGRNALQAQKESGIHRILAGFEMQDRPIARDGYPVLAGHGQKIGSVTSGSPAPFLKKNIGMAYVPVESSAPGTQIRIGIRSQEAAAKIVPLPFYKRPR
ncbi:MAG: glycine cleavage system aminomethyltransferase GcvT [Acidobacteria bacterium]|nr:MAG: glycine cleavage system aminomethyltransferase GcvT [Acidobacteriota bacterium]